MSEKSIIIDPGHGGTDPGANGFGVKEKDWNLKMSLYQFKRLKELGADVAITRTSDKTLDSVPRTNLIKSKYDFCISNHFNAFNGSARGVETIHSIYGGKAFATDIANELVKASGLPLRRVFNRKGTSGDYYFMHRLTGSTVTTIIEYGFIDNKTDHDWYKKEANFEKAAEAVIKAVCKHIGITYTSGTPPKKSTPKTPTSKGLYKVQAGAFSKRANAEALAKKLKKDGHDNFITQDGNLFKVQAGAFSKKENAEDLQKRLRKNGYDTFITQD